MNVLKNLNRRLGYKVCVYPITEIEGMQIDSPSDLIIMRNLFDGHLNNFLKLGMDNVVAEV